jgi:microcystin-dependent protein
MSDPYVGEIRVFPYLYAPEGWLECNGQVLSINTYMGLYGVIGNIYGGDIQKHTFGLPNLQGDIPLGAGQGPGLYSYTLNYKGGTMTETIDTTMMPAHSHSITVKVGKKDPQRGNAVFLSDPINADWNIPATRSNSTADYTGVPGFSTKATGKDFLSVQTLGANGGGPKGITMPHGNQQPFVVFRFCICWNGIFPVRP